MGEYKTKNEHPKGARTPQRFKGYRGLKDRRVGRFFKRTNTRRVRLRRAPKPFHAFLVGGGIEGVEEFCLELSMGYSYFGCAQK